MAHRETQDQSAIVLRHQRHARFRFSRRPVTISGSKHNLSLRRVTCPGLFAENVLTGIQGSRGDGGEILMWCRYNDRIDVFALEQFLPVRAGSAACFIPQRTSMLCNCVYYFDEFTLWLSLGRKTTYSSHATAPPNANPQLFHPTLPHP